MDNQIIIHTIASSIEMWQSFAFGILVLFISHRNKKQMQCFSIYLLVNGLSSVPYLFNLIVFKEQNLNLILLSNILTLGGIATFYHYITLLLVKKNRTLYKVIIYSSSLVFFIGFTLMFSTQEQLKQLSENISYFFRYVIFIVIIIQLIIHNRKVENQYSNIKNRELKLMLYVMVCVVLFPFFLMASFLPDDINRIVFSILILLFQLVIIYNGIYYEISTDLFVLEENTRNPKSKPIKNNIPKLKDASRTSELFEQIQTIIIDKQLFLEPELTIADVAKEINEHPKTTSQIINTNANQNFNTYINSFRVNYAKILLKNPENRHLTIEEIGKMAGFHSNSVFYTKFKNVLNVTPLQFQKDQKNK